MKTLSVKQPWASLICHGIKDVENRTWKAAAVPGRILIHASGKKVPKQMDDMLPIDMLSCINNHQLMGNLPEYDDMPTSAIIGYVEVTGFATQTDSPWDDGPVAIKWQLKDAYLFDEPICDVKGKLNLFDYPVDEDHLPPAHRVHLQSPKLEGEELVLPVSQAVFDDLDEDDALLSFDLTEENVNVLCQADSLSPNVMKTIRLVAPEAEARYEVAQVDTYHYIDEESNLPISYTSMKGEEYMWVYIEFVLGKKL